MGPDRPTLCAGWNTRDLLAHLLVRERQPWVAPGMIIPVLSPMVERATAGYATTPWSEMIAQLRDGPPSWSPFRVGKVDEFGNGAEFFVHHEDVRRGEAGWAPRPADPTRDAQLWADPDPDGRDAAPGQPGRGGAAPPVRRAVGHQDRPRAGGVIGEPSELLLHAFGRSAVQVELEGAPADVAALAGMARRA